MPPACRVGDKALCPADAHGKICCPHVVVGPAVSGSPNVLIEGRPALRWATPACTRPVAAPIRGRPHKAAPRCLPTTFLWCALAIRPPIAAVPAT